MIKIPNKCNLQVDIGNLEDIVDSTSEFSLILTEKIGNNIPTAEMTITLPQTIAPYLENEYCEVKLTFGFSEEERIYSRWQIVGFSEIGSSVSMLLTSDRAYINDIAHKSYNDTSVNTIKKVAKQYFSLVERDNKDSFQIQHSSDRMNWLQCGISPRDFIDTLWLHSYVGNKLIIPAITSNLFVPSDKGGTFRLVDLTDHKQIIEITRDTTQSNPSHVTIVEDLGYSSFSGKYNNLIGNRVDHNFNLDDDYVDCGVYRPSPIFLGTFNAKNIKTLSTPPRIISDNVHKNFSHAKTSNLARLSKFGAYSKRVQVADYDYTGKYHKNIVIGDIVSITVPYKNTNTTSDMHSGLYVVAETVQKISVDTSNQVYTKELVLRRDASNINEYKGVTGAKEKQ